jgi:tRNA 2-thiouridine synthesizing protein D
MDRTKTMTTLTIIIQDPPYAEGNKAWHALRLAGASMVEGMAVQVSLLEQGVEIARRGQRPPEGHTNLEDLLNELIERGLKAEGAACA